MNNPKARMFLDLLAKHSIVDLWIRTDRPNTYTDLPTLLMGREWVCLQYGLNLAIPIRDLYVGEGGVTGTLSFEYSPHLTRVQWEDVFVINVAREFAHVFDEEHAMSILQRSATEPGTLERLTKPQPAQGRRHKSGFRVFDGGKSAAREPSPKGAA